jgi:propionate CoA-transferase
MLTNTVFFSRRMSGAAMISSTNNLHLLKVLLLSQQQRSSSSRVFSSLSSFFKKGEFRIPPHTVNKVCTPDDAVSLISPNDTICVSGFVGQGSPDLILKALADRYERECNNEGIIQKGGGGVKDLTVLFGGGPGDWDYRGLNYLAKIPASAKKSMIKRSIGGHYGQVPLLGNLATSNQIEAWTLPMGSISRMIRAQATHSPGHITTVGLGTYVDPTPGIGVGGAANDMALASPLHQELVTKISIGFGPKADEMKHNYLMYKALPIQVAIIRATTADSSGNLSFEREF